VTKLKNNYLVEAGELADELPQAHSSSKMLFWAQALVMLPLEALALAMPVVVGIFPAGSHYETWAVLWLLWMGLYKKAYVSRLPFWAEMLQIVLGSMVLGIVAHVFEPASPWTKLTQGLTLTGLIFCCVLSVRVLGRLILGMLHLWGKPTLIIGSGPNAAKAYQALQSESWMGYKVVGFLDITDDCMHKQCPAHIPCIRWPFASKLCNWWLLMPFQCVIALEANQYCLRDELLMRLAQHKVSEVHVIPSLSGIPLFGAKPTYFFSHDVLSLSLNNNLAKTYLSITKRIFDIVAASVLIVCALPLMAWISWRIWREDGAPVVFSQTRIGQRGEPFKFYKFRSMVKNAEQVIHLWELNNTPEWAAYVANNFKLNNDPRVLKVGQLIRRTSMDELPQLFNVLMGQMSLVGPRPLMPRELREYGEELPLYGLVRPGLTGLWQVSGRSGTTFADRIAFDDWYIKNWSLWSDIAILFKTVKVVVLRIGAY
jgi:Undecaprenyl-phosphate galactose phosphotransferase WbaP